MRVTLPVKSCRLKPETAQSHQLVTTPSPCRRKTGSGEYPSIQSPLLIQLSISEACSRKKSASAYTMITRKNDKISVSAMDFAMGLLQ